MQANKIKGNSSEQRCPFSERFLQVIWNQRHLQYEMQTEGGKALRVISPGTWNVSSGPDFHSSSLLFDGTLVSGSVEIHRYASDWRRHGHDTDPNYRQVVLHAVWQNDEPVKSDGMETVVLSRYLQADWEHLLWELEDACYPYARQVASGECALRWALTDDVRVQELLKTAGLARFAAKSSELMRQAATRGLEQALYEAIFDALGYQANRQPFQELATAVPLSRLQALPTPAKRQALLFGMAGLLPDMTVEKVAPEWQAQVARLWDEWWSLGLNIPSKPQWKLAGLRPYNSPCRRLAAGIELLEHCKYTPAQWLRSIAEHAADSQELWRHLQALNHPDSPWRQFRDFGHPIHPAADVLGQSRLLDLLANVLLPYLTGMVELTEGPTAHASQVGRQLYLALPRLQKNRLYQEAIQRFLIPPSREVELVKLACQQQGFLNIYKSFCLALDNNCDLCPLNH